MYMCNEHWMPLSGNFNGLAGRREAPKFLRFYGQRELQNLPEMSEILVASWLLNENF